MTDREMLELAAKAAGIRLSGEWSSKERMWADTPESWWNPLTDDGDALRLAVKLCSSLQFTPPASGFDGFVQAWPTVGVEHVEEEYGSDANAATRRAIVRVAAEIGRALP
jgi:hypothetical protein